MGLLVAPGPVAAQTAEVLGLEITQAIQNLSHEVPLIRGKSTAVRLYLKLSGFLADQQVRGEIAVAQSSGAPALYVASSNAIVTSSGDAPLLSAQRRDLDASLNFLLPAQALQWPALSVHVSRIYGQAGDLPIAPAAPLTLPFVDAPALRVRAIGLRYAWQRPDGSTVQVAPDAFHFDHLRSFLLRAYPIAAIEWSQLVVQAHPLFAPPFSGPPQSNGDDPVWIGKLNLAHNQLAALRAKDMDDRNDPRTHYYGLVSDASAGLFFRGAAKDIPDAADPSVVAVGPVGDPKQYPRLSWDKTPSFAGWYGTHELSHTFGCYHPGFCGQDASDKAFPYSSGRIGDEAKGDMIGFDLGDPALGLPMRVLAHETSHDIMTYCDNQWISAYSYEAVLTRLRQENVQFTPTV